MMRCVGRRLKWTITTEPNKATRPVTERNRSPALSWLQNLDNDKLEMRFYFYWKSTRQRQFQFSHLIFFIIYNCNYKGIYCYPIGIYWYTGIDPWFRLWGLKEKNVWVIKRTRRKVVQLNLRCEMLFSI